MYNNAETVGLPKHCVKLHYFIFLSWVQNFYLNVEKFETCSEEGFNIVKVLSQSLNVYLWREKKRKKF